MAATGPLGPQTGFGRLTHGLQEVTTELRNLSNLPAFDQGAAIIDMLRQIQHQNQQFQDQIRDQMQQFQDRVNRDITTIRNDMQTIRDDIQALRTEIQTTNRASQHNSIARLENSVARRGNTPLFPFRAYATNVVIPGFPGAPADITGMTGAQLDPILQALDEDTTDNVAARRRRLSIHIGLGHMTAE